jgi:hypothetical protein
LIRKLENINKIEKEQIMDFIKKASPFTEQNSRLHYVVSEFIADDMQRPYMVAMNESTIDPVTKINSLKHFVIWSNKNTLYVGTEFISEPEVTAGVNLSKYEQSAT